MVIYELYSLKKEPLKVYRDTLFMLNIILHVFNGLRALHIDGNGASLDILNEDWKEIELMEHQLYGGFFLNVIASKSA